MFDAGDERMNLKTPQPLGPELPAWIAKPGFLLNVDMGPTQKIMILYFAYVWKCVLPFPSKSLHGKGPF